MDRQYLPARLAGACYPRPAGKIRDFFRGFFPALPQPLPENGAPPDSFLAVLAPHIDFRVSTRSYALAYAPWFSAPAADYYVILGVGHRARQEWSLDARAYQTPLGTVPSWTEGLEAFLDGVDYPLLEDPRAHEGEHSIEFPLLCLQAFRERRGIQTPFAFLPLLCGGLHRDLERAVLPEKQSLLHSLATVLRKLRKQYGSRLHIIVSIDGCHVGPRFQHPYPVTPAVRAGCAEWEEELWQTVEKNDFTAFFSHLLVDQNHRHFDGVGALALFLHAFGPRCRLQRSGYEQWFDPSDHSMVTFSSGHWRLDPPPSQIKN
jgi:AmmeMemoRadiSam system protein B